MFSVLIHLTLNHYRVESAKLRALRAHVPTCVACLRVNVPCVLTCLSANVPCVLTCKRASRAYLTTYLACLSAQMPMCLRANVVTGKGASSSLSHLPAFLT